MHTAEGGSAALGTVEYELQQRRAALASQPGIKGLIQNGRTSMICVFASMGGLIYG